MTFSYLSSLKNFKRSLTGGSEIDVIVEGITKNISTHRIRWFDVGIGDGVFLKKIISALESKGFIVEVSGTDIDIESVRKAINLFPGGKIFNEDFLKLNLKEKYDVFSFNQSIYYFKDVQKVIKKAFKNLAEGGLIYFVSWSQKDDLYKLNKYFFEKNYGFLNDKALLSSEFLKNFVLKNFKNLNLVFDNNFKGTVNFNLWKDPSILKSSLYIISRSHLEKDYFENFKINHKDILSKIKLKKGVRVNNVLIFKKPYDIPDFTRKKINSILVKKFPSYKKIIKKTRGDLEALFMASWEKETEYLSEYVAPGKVLEICCAAGFKSVILGKRHRVVAVDINDKRLNSARYNAKLFNVDKNILFKKIDAENFEELKTLDDDFDAIYVDADWRENLSDPIKKQNLDPFKTTPRTDKLYFNLRKLYPKTPIIFKVSPFVNVKKMEELDPCIIEELYIDGKFLSYNVYYDPYLKKSRWQKIFLFNKK